MQMAQSEVFKPGSRHVVCLEKDLEPIVTRFLARKRAEIPRLRAALQEQDFEEIRRLGHDLKGAGEGFGFPDLTTVGALLERGGRSRDGGAINEQIDAMERFLASIEVHYS
jgi:HPt (histidine-containing phosphotransfer) domain-containing protein